MWTSPVISAEDFPNYGVLLQGSITSRRPVRNYGVLSWGQLFKYHNPVKCTKHGLFYGFAWDGDSTVYEYILVVLRKVRRYLSMVAARLYGASQVPALLILGLSKRQVCTPMSLVVSRPELFFPFNLVHGASNPLTATSMHAIHHPACHSILGRSSAR